MLKTFNQSFKKSSPSYYLLLEDSRSEKNRLYVFRDDCGCYLSHSFDLQKGEDLPLKLVKELHGLGFATVSYREIARHYDTIYSYIDATPGRVWEQVCLHVIVDTSHIPPKPAANVALLPFEDAIHELHSSVAAIGLGQLLSERGN